jgi:hypothetical protein
MIKKILIIMSSHIISKEKKMFNSYKKDQKSSSKNATIQKNRFQGEFCPIGRPRENDVPHCWPK